MKNTSPLLSSGEKDARPRSRFKFVKFAFIILAVTLALYICTAGIQKPTGKGGSEIPVSKCCKQQKTTPAPAESCTCGEEKKSGKRGKLNKWVKKDKKGEIKEDQKEDIKNALREDEVKEKKDQGKADDKAKTEAGENDIKEDDPRGFTVHKRKVVLDKGKKEKDDGAMTMMRSKAKKPGEGGTKRKVDWEENHIKPKVKSSKNVKKVDGDYGFHQSKLKTYAANRIRMKQKAADIGNYRKQQKKKTSEQSLAEHASPIQPPNGDAKKLKPETWKPSKSKD